MPYTNDPRRTVTINLYPDDYEALAEDALAASYPTPGTYAKALVLNRGEAPEPIWDEYTTERILRLEGKNAWLLEQFEATRQLLHAARIPFKLVNLPAGELPRSRAAQDRAVARAVKQAVEPAVRQAVADALAQERARVAARRAARQQEVLALPPPPAGQP